MIKSACNVMKKAVLVSVAFFFGGGLLVLLSQQIPLETALPAFVSYLGFFLIFAGALVMAVTIIMILLPKVSHQLDLCQH